ncbi:MAG: ISLre2 family transposase, partial [Nostoc sp.]
LHNLSKSQEFLHKTMQKTQGWWHNKTRKHGCKKRQILTVGNVAVTLKLPYVVERQTQPKKNQKSLHEGFCPFLRYLGMSEGLTPGVLSTIARYGAIAGSFEAA